MNKLIAIFALFSICSCAVTPERHREARLMPAQVAKAIIAKHTSPAWADRPRLQAWQVNHPLCDDDSFHDIQYEHIRIAWDTVLSAVTVNSDQKIVGFWCGSYLSANIKYTTIEEREDLIDAFISLGAKIKVSQK